VVVLEGDRAAVVGEEVGLDDDALRAPEEVDRPAAEPDVDLRAREVVAVDDGEKEGLEIGAGVVGLGPFEAVALELGLAGGSADQAGREQR
jgi:hypothetical protein